MGFHSVDFSYDDGEISRNENQPEITDQTNSDLQIVASNNRSHDEKSINEQNPQTQEYEEEFKIPYYVPEDINEKPSKKKLESKSNLPKSTPSKPEEISRKEETPMTGTKRKRESLATSAEVPPKRLKKGSKKSRDAKPPAPIKSSGVSTKMGPPKSSVKNKGNATTGVETEKQQQNPEPKSGKTEKSSNSRKKPTAEESEESESADGLLSSDLDELLSKTQKVKKNSHKQSSQVPKTLDLILKETQTPVASEESVDEEEERLKEESGLSIYTQHS